MADEFDQYRRKSQAPPDDEFAQYVRAEAPVSLTPGTPGSGSAGRFASSMATAINPMGIVDIAKEAADPKIGLAKTLKTHFYDPQAEQFSKAGDAAMGRGEFAGMSSVARMSSTLAHGAAGALPLVGPAAANAGDQIGDGDVAGGMGTAAGVLAGMAIPKAAKSTGGTLYRAAEPIAENALGIRAVDRKFGRTPGRAALDETTGVRPATINRQAVLKISDLAKQRDAALASSPAQLSLRPARQFVDERILDAQKGNSEPSHILPVQEHLTEPHQGFAGRTSRAMPQPGAAGPVGPLKIAEMQDPTNFYAIQKRLGKDFTKFDTARPVANEAREVANEAYGKMNQELRDKVPDAARLNTRLSNLIPIKEAAAVREAQPGIVGNVAQRIGAKTGSLVLGAVGYQQGGIPGLVTGAVIPEMISNPTVQMATARTLNAGGKALRSPAGGRVAQSPFMIRPAKKSREATQ